MRILQKKEVNLQTLEERQAIVAKLTAMDDVLFEKLVEDKETSQEMLRTFLQNKTLKIETNIPQMHIRNIDNRSIEMDLMCTDDNDNHFAVEMQKADNDDHIRRVRYHASNIDTRLAEAGSTFANIPDLYMIYVTKNDFLKGKKTVYHVERKLAETGKLVYNGINEIYVNSEINDGSEIATYMKLLKSTNDYDEHFPITSKRIRYFKQTNEGVNTMCDLVEQYAQKQAKEIQKNDILILISTLRKHGISDKTILDNIMESYHLTHEVALSYM